MNPKHIFSKTSFICTALALVVMALSFSSCNKERYVSVRFEVESTYMPFEWSCADVDPDKTLFTTIVDDGMPHGSSLLRKFEGVTTWMSATTMAPDSVYNKLRCAIYVEDQLVAMERKEGYGPIEIYVSGKEK